MGEAERREALRIIESEDFGVDPKGMERAANLLLSTGVGGITGFAAGGPPGALVGAAAGFGGELAAQEVERRTGSTAAGMGAGLATDLAITLASRRPSSALMRRISPSRLSTSARAGQLLERGELLGRVGPEGATEVSDAVIRRYDQLVELERSAWAAARAANRETTRVSSAPLKKVAREVLDRTRLRPNNERSQAAQLIFGKDDLGKPNIGQTVGLDDAQEILSSIAEDVRTSQISPDLKRRSVGARELRGAVDRMLDQIERQGASDSEAVRALRTARSATAQKYAAIPERSVLFRSVVGERAFDQPEKALQAILRSRQPVKEVEKILDLIGGDEVAQRALRRVAVQRIYGRVTGATGEIAPRSAGAAASRGTAESRVLRQILGEKGFRRIQEINRKLFQSVRRSDKFLPTLRARKAPGGAGVISSEMGVGGIFGALIGYAVGGGQAAATGALTGATTAAVIDHVAQRLGPNAARALAIEALLDEKVMQQVVKRVSGNATIDRAIESFVRRGLIEFTDITGSSAPKSDVRIAQ